MTRLGCLRNAELLTARAAGLSEADRLRLEEHLESCAACRGDAQALDALIAIGRESERIVLSERAVQRALHKALAGAGRGPEAAAQAPPSRRLWPSLGLGLGLAAAATVGVLVWRAPEQRAPRAGTAPPGAAPTATHPSGDATPAVRAAVARVLAGRVVSDAQASLALEAGAEVPADLGVFALADSELALGHAQIVVPAQTRLRWRPATRTVELTGGALLATIDPEVNEPFAVSTAHFRVEVVGTRFEVTPTSVKVYEGTVRVRGPGGKVLVDALGPGGRWQLEPTIAANAPPVGAGGAGRPGRGADERAGRPDSDARDPGALLAAARSAIADGRLDVATTLIERATRQKPTRAQRAEAESLLAERELVAGRTVDAARRFEKVADAWRDLPAGESALYAAARAWARAGKIHRAAAKAAAQRYLGRYPDGRFATEARALLEP